MLDKTLMWVGLGLLFLSIAALKTVFLLAAIGAACIYVARRIVLLNKARTRPTNSTSDDLSV